MCVRSSSLLGVLKNRMVFEAPLLAAHVHAPIAPLAGLCIITSLTTDVKAKATWLLLFIPRHSANALQRLWKLRATLALALVLLHVLLVLLAVAAGPLRPLPPGRPATRRRP